MTISIVLPLSYGCTFNHNVLLLLMMLLLQLQFWLLVLSVLAQMLFLLSVL